MALTPNSLISIQTPNAITLLFTTTAVTGTYVTAYAGALNGSKITAIWASNSDTAAGHSVTAAVQRDGVNYGGAIAFLPITAGFSTAAPPVNIMAPSIWPGLPIDSDGNPYLLLASTHDSLVVALTTVIATAGLRVFINGVVGDF